MEAFGFLGSIDSFNDIKTVVPVTKTLSFLGSVKQFSRGETYSFTPATLV